jgi:hypothetical protein
VTALVKSLILKTTRKSLWVGALARVAVWIVVDVPVTSLWAIADLTNPIFAVGTFILHIVYSIVTALVAMVRLRRDVSTLTEA